jgi:hypothetical protein
MTRAWGACQRGWVTARQRPTLALRQAADADER